MSTRTELADFLEAAGISPVVFSFHDSAPDECIALFPYAGSPPLHVKGTQAAVMELPRMQVVARGDEEGAERLAQRVYVALDGLSRVELGGTVYAAVRALQSPVGADERSRVKFVFNVDTGRARFYMPDLKIMVGSHRTSTG